ncbi:MAG: VWA domain-containing protein [Vicinamibacterales bacterium]
MRIRALILLVAVTLAAHVGLARQTADPAAPQGKQPPVTFRQEVNYVEVDAVITDAQGNFLRDLSQADFQVLEDGKPQTLSTFSLVDIPIKSADRPLFAEKAIPADTKSNADDFGGRLYMLVLDDLHTNALRSTLVRNAAKRFVERYMADNDIAAVVHSSGRTDASQEFTNSKPRLTAAINKFMGRKVRSETLGKIEQYNTTPATDRTGPPTDPDDFERGYNARNTLGSLKNLANYLSGVRGRRKALVFFSEGIDYDIYDIFNKRDASAVLDDVREAIGAATRANVSIYAVDPRGLTGMGDDDIEIGGLPDDPSLGLGSRSFQSELRLAQDSLRVLADETGGFAVVNTNDFGTAFDRVVRDNSAYYILGYYPTNDRRDGKTRKIQVKVSRPGAVVRARKGYVAPRGKTPAKEAEATQQGSAAMKDAMQSPLQVAGLTMTVHAAPFKGVAPNASVAISVQLDPHSLGFVEKDGLFHNELEVSTLAIDAAGKSFPGERNTLKLDLRPQTHQAVERAGFRLQSRLNLPPGRYQLRVAAREANENRTGSVFYDLDVPNFSNEGTLAMSGILLTSSSATASPTARPDEQFKDVLPAPATAARDFGADEALATFVEIYDNTKFNEHKVDITTTIKSDDGRSMFSTTEERAKSEIQGGKGGYGVTARIPLTEFTPGLYVLSVEAKSRASGVAPVSRDVQFRVRKAEASKPTASSTAPASGGGASPLPQAPTPQSAIVNVARGAQSGVTEYRETVARTDDELKALWSAAAVRGGAPPVNFQTTMVAAVFLGTRPTAGYSVEIVGVQRAGTTLEVLYTERTPAAGTISAQVVVTPFHVVGVPRFDGDVRFIKVTQGQ